MTTYLFFYQVIFEWSHCQGVPDEAVFNMMDLLLALKLKSGLSISAFDKTFGRVVLAGGAF